METCLDPRFERVMDEFAELNRRLFRAFARLPVNFVHLSRRHCQHPRAGLLARVDAQIHFPAL